MAGIPTGTPGFGTEKESAHRRVLISDHGAVIYPAGVLVDGDNARDPDNTGDLDVLRAGVMLGKITASQKIGASVLGKSASDYAAGGATLTVTAQCAVEINRRFGSSGSEEILIVGAATAAGTVNEEAIDHSAVNVTSGAVIVTPLTNSYLAGSLIFANDGCETIIGIIGDGTGLKVTDADGEDQDTPLHAMIVGGILDASMIVNWPGSTLTTLITELKSKIRANGIGHVFSDDIK